MVLVDRVFDDFDVDSVSVSNFEGAKKAVDFLYSRGVKRPVCFTISPVYISSIHDRIQGYLSTIKNESEAKLFQIPHDNIEEAVSNALTEIKHNEYDGIFCVNNSIAKAILRSASSDSSLLTGVEIISFDDIEIFDIVHPKISSISQPIHEIGKNAVNCLIEHFEHQDTHIPEHIVLETVLIKR